MTTYFVSRHPGARDWAMDQNIGFDRLVTHLDPNQVQQGDTIIGTLPVNLAAEICEAGGHYLHLSLRLPSELRGIELTADELRGLDATLEAYQVQRIDADLR